MPFPTSHQPPEPGPVIEVEAEAVPEPVIEPEETAVAPMEPEAAPDETMETEPEDHPEAAESVPEIAEAGEDHTAETEAIDIDEPDPEVEMQADEDAEIEEESLNEDVTGPESEIEPDEHPVETETAEAAGGTDAASNVVPLRKKGAEDGDSADDEDPPKKGGSDIDDHYLRVIEALLFAAKEPLDIENVAARLPEGVDAAEVLEELQRHYRDRGVVLVKTGNRWSFRTAPDLTGVLEIETEVTRKLSRAAIETLAIIAYHQPVTRGEMEEVRGVALSRGTLDVLLEAGWIRPGKRRRTPGRPVAWVTTPKFLDHFGLGGLDELPGLDELKAAGLLDTRPALGIYRERDEDDEAEDEENQEDLFDETDLASNLMEAEET